jgi:hypothetical protein
MLREGRERARAGVQQETQAQELLAGLAGRRCWGARRCRAVVSLQIGAEPAIATVTNGMPSGASSPQRECAEGPGSRATPTDTQCNSLDDARRPSQSVVWV